MRSRGQSFAIAFTLILAGTFGACSTGTTTKMTLDDVNDMTLEMGVSLRSSNFLRDRTSDSPRVLVAVDRAQNLTRDVIPVGEQWLIMQRIKDSAALQQISREKNLAFVLPAVHMREGLARGAYDLADAFTQRHPTHQLSGSLIALSRAADEHRTDLYVCEFHLVEIETGVMEWTDTFEFKRIAQGKSYN